MYDMIDGSDKAEETSIRNPVIKTLAYIYLSPLLLLVPIIMIYVVPILVLFVIDKILYLKGDTYSE